MSEEEKLGATTDKEVEAALKELADFLDASARHPIANYMAVCAMAEKSRRFFNVANFNGNEMLIFNPNYKDTN